MITIFDTDGIKLIRQKAGLNQVVYVDSLAIPPFNHNIFLENF
jgi:hypothetical protein